MRYEVDGTREAISRKALDQRVSRVVDTAVSAPSEAASAPSEAPSEAASAGRRTPTPTPKVKAAPPTPQPRSIRNPPVMTGGPVTAADLRLSGWTTIKEPRKTGGSDTYWYAPPALAARIPRRFFHAGRMRSVPECARALAALHSGAAAGAAAWPGTPAAARGHHQFRAKFRAGDRVEVFWDGEGKHYAGAVASVGPDPKRPGRVLYQVAYDDGETCPEREEVVQKEGTAAAMRILGTKRARTQGQSAQKPKHNHKRQRLSPFSVKCEETIADGVRGIITTL